MSNISKYQMNLDVQQDYPQSRPYLRIDDREEITLDVTITSDGDTLDLTGYDIYFECKKSDGRIIRDTENITVNGATSGNVSYKLNNEIATSSGHISIAYFALEKDGSRVTTRNFSLIVMPSAFTEFIASKNYLTEIEIIVNDIVERVTVSLEGVEEDFANQINVQIERIDELSKLIDDTIIEVDGKITGLTSDVDEFVIEINTQMESLRELVQIETDRVNGLITLIDNQEDVINDAIILMNEKIFLQEKLISDFQISVNARLEQINADITNRVNEYIVISQTAIDKHVDESNVKLDDLEDRIEGLEGGLDDLDTYSKPEIDAKDDAILEEVEKKANSEDLIATNERIVNPNLLINSCYLEDVIVNQRGNTEFTDSTYWKYFIDANELYLSGGYTLSLYSSYLRIDTGSYVNGKACVRQKIDIKRFTSDKTHTFNVRFLATEGSEITLFIKRDNTILKEETFVGTGEWTIESISRGQLHGNYYDNVIVEFDFESSLVDSICFIEYMKFEKGEKATTFIDDDPTTKLMKCRYYLQRITGSTPVGQTDVYGFGVHVPIAGMRATPTIITSDSTILPSYDIWHYADGIGVIANVVHEVTIESIETNSVKLHFDTNTTSSFLGYVELPEEGILLSAEP